MLKLFKQTISFLIADNKQFKLLSDISNVIQDIQQKDFNDVIKNENNKQTFKNILIKYILLLYFIYNNIKDDEIIKTCNVKFKRYTNPDIILSIKNNNNIINSLFKSKDIYNNQLLTNEQLKELNDIKKPSKISLEYIYDCLNIIEFKNDKLKLNKINNDEFFEQTETSTIDIIYNMNKDINILELNTITTNQQNQNLIQDMYEFIQKDKQEYTNNQLYTKILSLINSKILMPITNEILLKHQNNLKYKTNTQHNDNAKIEYITTKINNAINKIEPVKDGTIDINEIENVNIIINNNVNITDQLRKYTDFSYINYYNPQGLFIKLTQPIISIRQYLLLESQKDIYKNNGEMNQIDLVGFGIILKNNKKYKKQTYNEFIKSIKHYLKGKLDENVYWIYEKDDDKNILTFTTQEEKLIYLFDNLYNIIITQKNKLLYKKLINFKHLTHQLINYYINEEFKEFPELLYDGITISNLQLTTEQKNLINQKLLIEEEKDDKTDKLYGLDKDTIKLPSITEKKDKKILLTSAKKEDTLINSIMQKSICIHIIEYNNLKQLYKTDILTFDKNIQAFLYKYVGQLSNGTKICKACGAKLNLYDLNVSGTYDDNKHFNAESIDLWGRTKLETIGDYVNYKHTIKTLDGIINKIGKITNLLYITGEKYDRQQQRKTYIRNIIDMINYNTQNFDKFTMDKRYEMGEKVYGINRGYTDFFTFMLTDDILKTVSYTKDYQKDKKANNIMIYTLINIIIDIDESNIYNMEHTKTCDIESYKKINKLFNNIKIKLENTTVYITKYPVLCYIIFMFACLLSTYNIYHLQGADNNTTDKKIINQNAIKIMIKIIMTTIDILNSLVEVYIKLKSTENNESIEIVQFYTRFYSKYSNKINTIFSKREILKNLEKPEIKKIIIKSNNDEQKLTNIIDSKFDLPPCYVMNRYEVIEQLNNYIKTNEVEMQKYSILLNCENGGYHKFINDNNTIKCEYCNKTFDDLTKMKKTTYDLLNKNNQLFYIKNIAQHYCFTKDNIGKKHTYVYSEKDKSFKCKNCGYIKNDDINEKDLINLGIKYYEKNIINSTQYKERELIEIPKLKKEIIDNFLNFVPEKEILINNNNIKIFDNEYSFDHNYLGYRISPPLILNENKITHSYDKYFNKDVYSYVDKKFTVYYDENTNILLGYKEQNGNYTKNNQVNIYKALIKHSIKDELKTLFNEDNIIENNKLSNDTEYINISNFIMEYIIGINLYNNQNTEITDNSFHFSYYISKLNKIGKTKISTDDLFNNWEDILKQSKLLDNSHNYFILYVLFEITEFINNINSKEQQKIIIEMTIDYIDFFYKRTKLNLNNDKDILLMTDIIKYFRDDKRYLLFGDETIEKYVQIKDETSSSNSSSSSSSESESEVDQEKMDISENIQLDEEGANEGFDVDVDEDDEDDADYVMGMIDD